VKVPFINANIYFIVSLWYRRNIGQWRAFSSVPSRRNHKVGHGKNFVFDWRTSFTVTLFRHCSQKQTTSAFFVCDGSASRSVFSPAFNLSRIITRSWILVWWKRPNSLPRRRQRYWWRYRRRQDFFSPAETEDFDPELEIACGSFVNRYIFSSIRGFINHQLQCLFF
jgi:hypothetical protein